MMIPRPRHRWRPRSTCAMVLRFSIVVSKNLSFASFNMASYGVLSCLDTFPTHMNPFDVLINKSQFQYAFPEYTDVHSGSVTVLFTVGQLKNRSKSRLLLCAHPTVDDSPGPEDRNKPIILLVSRLFLRHHDLQHKSAGAVRLFPTSFLSKVVIGAKSKHSFKWASSANFSTGLQVLASDGQTLLAREGDKLLLPYHPLFGDNWAQVQQLLLDLVVLSCSPVRQGRITASSCIVVSDLSEPPGCLSPAKPRTKLFVSDFAHFSNSLYRSSSLLANKKALTSGFSGFLQALEGRVDVRVANLLPLLKDTHFRGQDLDSIVLVSKNLLMKLGLFNHEWVVLSELKPQNSIDVSLPRGGRLASLLAMDLTPLSLELHLNDTSGLISTTHWFNLSGGETVPTANRTLRIKVSRSL